LKGLPARDGSGLDNAVHLGVGSMNSVRPTRAREVFYDIQIL